MTETTVTPLDPIDVDQVLEQIGSTPISILLSTLWQTFLRHLPDLLLALGIFLIGWLLIKLGHRLLRGLFIRLGLSPALSSFLLSFSRVGTFMVLLLICAAILGIPTASLVAILGALSLALSLAAKDALANLAGGLQILASHPFEIDDYIEADSATGTVCDVGLIHTRLRTVDNKLIYIPNGQLTSMRIVNYSKNSTRRLDLTFSIGYECDFNQAKQIIANILNEHPCALTEPAPIVRVSSLGESSVEIACMVWVARQDLLTLKFDLLEAVKTRFDQNGITIPYRQVDVHLSPVPSVDAQQR